MELVSVQALMRGWLVRRKLNRFTQSIVTIQRWIRGWLQRIRYKALLVEKLLQDQEELFETQVRKVEAGLGSPSFRRDLPRLAEEHKFTPKKKWRHSEFDFDLYILAALEIQRRYRGYLVRKAFGGSFRRFRMRITHIQRLFRSKRSSRADQLNRAAVLLAKEANILTNTFRSYQHLRTLLATQDFHSKFASLLAQVDNAVSRTGISCDSSPLQALEARIAQLEASNKSLAEDIEAYRHKHKADKSKTLNGYLRSLKTVKCQMELAYKSNMEQLALLARSVLRDREDSDSDEI
jgi:hypothetical protein